MLFRFECGEVNPSIRNIEQLADDFNIGPRNFLRGSQEQITLDDRFIQDCALLIRKLRPVQKQFLAKVLIAAPKQRAQ